MTCYTTFGITIVSMFMAFTFGQDNSSYFEWKLVGTTEEIVYCPISCKDVGYQSECCSCHGAPCWSLQSPNIACNNTVGPVFLEYMDIFGNSEIVLDPTSNASVHELIHKDGKLQNLPQNTCDFSKTLVHVNLANNKIVNVSIISCLSRLDTLKLDYNKITHLSNTTFSNMPHLRVLTLSFNQIVAMDPNTLRIPTGNIGTVDLRNNTLGTIDVTNIVRPGEFCILNFEGCEVTEQTNILNYSLNDSKIIHGPGTINFNNTKGELFINFTNLGLGINDYNDIPKYFSGNLFYSNNSIRCDCNLYPIINSLGFNIYDIWPNLLADVFPCVSPESMKGVDLKQIIRNQEQDRLRCGVQTMCPYPCTCEYVPDKERTIVNCSNTGITELPEFMPMGLWNQQNVVLLCDGNLIERLGDRPYLRRVQTLSLKDNPLKYVDENAFRLFEDTQSLHLDISSQTLTEIPGTIKLLNPASVEFGNHPVPCSCDNTWLGGWLKSWGADHKLNCSVDGVILPAAQVTDTLLGCKLDEAFPIYPSILVIAFSVICLTSLILSLYCFRYELVILKRRYFARKKTCDQQIYVSFSDNDQENSYILIRSVIKWLKCSGYNIIGRREILPGEDLDEKILELIEASQVYLVCLSKNFQTTRECVFEFDKIWHLFMDNSNRKLIVINFDNLGKRALNDPRLYAFRRTREELNYKETESRLLDRLKKKLGSPSAQDMIIYRTGEQCSSTPVREIGRTSFKQRTTVWNLE